MSDASDIEAERALSDQLRSLEIRLLEPAVRASRANLEALLAPQFREFASNGQIYDRQQVIDMLLGEQPADRALSEFRATLLAPGVALVTYRYRRTMRDGSIIANSLRSSVWRLDSGAWRMVFNQGTRVAESDASLRPA